MSKFKNFLLIGMPGSGKSFIGKQISEKYGIMFFDLDKIIEEKHGKIINIFNNFGEEYFRELEKKEFELIKNYNKDKIISVGGGFIETIDYQNINIKDFFVIYINTSKNEIIKNLYSDMEKNIRPLFLENKNNQYINLENKIDNLFKKREPLFLKHCNIIFDSKQGLSILENIF